MAANLLLQRRYALEDQLAFARLSGDFNPIHVDPIAARRTLTGAVTVHGLHLVLTGLESFLRSALFPQGKGLTALRAAFQKPVLIGDEVSFVLDKAGDESKPWKLRVLGGDDVLCKIDVALSEGSASSHASLPPLTETPLRDLGFDQLAGLEGALLVGIDLASAALLFPSVLAQVGGGTLAELLVLTRLVGMECPGLHSLLGNFDVRIEGTSSSDSLRYRVEEADPRFQSIDIAVEGGRVKGRIKAFRRPSPQRQATMAEVGASVLPGEFAQTVALIVGGSRGLGEITAKIIAAGGGLPIVTYHRGRADAERLAEEIGEGGGRCQVLPLDIAEIGSFLETFAPETQVRSLYYFATPRISKRRAGALDDAVLQEFNAYYSVAFGELIEGIARHSVLPLRVFYPSSIYAEEAPKDLSEYGLAKRTGEERCASYNQQADRFRILVERLPRVETDQTASIFQSDAAGGLPTMLPLIRRVEG